MIPEKEIVAVAKSGEKIHMNAAWEIVSHKPGTNPNGEPF